MTKDYNVRIPQLSSVEKAVQIYYAKTELSNADIKELFGEHSSATINRLKSKVRAKMAEEKVPVWNAQCVNTKKAFEVWGLDISDLEHRLKKLRELRELTA